MNISKFRLLCCLLLIASAGRVFAMDGIDEIADLVATSMEEENKAEREREEANKALAFRTIQTIHRIAGNVAEDAKKRDGTRLDSGEKGWPEPRPSRGLTERGLFLAIESYPESLHTPWGKKEIYGGASGRYNGFLSIFQAFKNAGIVLKFVRNTGEGETTYGTYGRDEKIKLYKHIYDPQKNKYSNEEISQEELDRLRGTDTHVTAHYCGYPSIYEIVSVGDTILPEPVHAERPHDWQGHYDQTMADWNSRKNIADETYPK